MRALAALLYTRVQRQTNQAAGKWLAAAANMSQRYDVPGIVESSLSASSDRWAGDRSSVLGPRPRHSYPQGAR